MTPEQKVALLKEAGVWDVIGFPGCIEKLIDLVAAHEREACAKVCEDQDGTWWPCKSTGAECATIIRAMGGK